MHVSLLHLLLSWLKYDISRLAATRSILPSSGSSTSFIFNVRFTTNIFLYLFLPSSRFFLPPLFLFSFFLLEIIDVYTYDVWEKYRCAIAVVYKLCAIFIQRVINYQSNFKCVRVCVIIMRNFLERGLID